MPQARYAVVLALVVVAAGCGGPRPDQGDTTDEDLVGGQVSTTPLAGPSAAGETLLTLLAPEDTGVAGGNELPFEKFGKYTQVGGGIAAGDYDGDGLADLYVVSEGGPSHLYRNLGGWRFEDVTEESGVTVARQVAAGRWRTRYPMGATFLDYNNDGRLDLYVTAFAGANTLFENDGDGTFTDVTAAAGVGYVGASTTATVADYDRDGFVDIFVATYRPYGLSRLYPAGASEEDLEYDLERFPDGSFILLPEKDVLYHNNGDGTFSDVAAEAGVGEHRDWGLGARFADANGDGWPDLYVADDFISPDRFYINNRDGTFRELGNDVFRASSMFSMGMDFGDVNNDGRLDYITTDMVSGDRVRRLVQLIEVLGNPTARDPEPDTAVQVRRNTLNIANGDGTYNEIGLYAGVDATEWTWAVRFVDVDLDGFQDLLVANGFVDDAMNADLQQRLITLQERNDREGLRKAILERPLLPTANTAFRNTGRLRFEDVSEEWGFAHEGISVGMALADFDGDGDLDVAVNNTNSPASIFRNGATAHRLKVSLRGTASNRLGVGARISLETPSGSQYRELGTSGGYVSGSEPVVVFGLGSATTAGPLTVAWPSGQRTVIDQVTADEHLVIVEPRGTATPAPAPTPGPTQFEEVAAALGASYRHRESAHDDYGRQRLLPYSLSRFGPGVAWGDLDGDGFDDLYVAAGRGSASGVFTNDGGRGLQALPSPEEPAARMEEQAPLWWPRPDGLADVLVSLGAEETAASPPYPVVRRLINDAGRLVAGDLAAMSPSSGGALAAADYNGDGYLDLFAGGRARPGAYPLPATSHLYRGGPRGLTAAPAADAPELAEAGLVTGALWSDVDGDGDSDLVVATDWGPVKLFRNEDGRLRDATAEAGLAGATGWWRGIAAGDVDHDGDPDLVVTNLGTNTRHRAAEGQPLVLYAGDFDGDGNVDIVETEWDNGRLYPARNRRELGDEIEGLFGRYSTYEEFARTPVEDLLGSDALASGLRLEANWLEHALFINEGGGRFAPPRALPPQAQLMAGFGVTVADLDADGHEDVYMVGNFMGAESAATGPMVGGVSLWLRGDGTGAFEAVPVTESGLSVPGDAKGLAATDLEHDGWVDLAVGVNDGPLMLFHNRGVAGRRGLTVRLVGPPGNRGAAGAVVAVTRSDGLVLTREVRAGSSFLSQDSNLQVFGLGDTTGPVDVVVRWPSGQEERLRGVQPRGLLEIRQESEQ